MAESNFPLAPSFLGVNNYLLKIILKNYSNNTIILMDMAFYVEYSQKSHTVWELSNRRSATIYMERMQRKKNHTYHN